MAAPAVCRPALRVPAADRLGRGGAAGFPRRGRAAVAAHPRHQHDPLVSLPAVRDPAALGTYLGNRRWPTCAPPASTLSGSRSIRRWSRRRRTRGAHRRDPAHPAPGFRGRRLAASAGLAAGGRCGAATGGLLADAWRRSCGRWTRPAPCRKCSMNRCFPAIPPAGPHLQHAVLEEIRQALPTVTVAADRAGLGQHRGPARADPGGRSATSSTAFHLYDPPELTSLAAYRPGLDRAALAQLPFPVDDRPLRGHRRRRPRCVHRAA